MSDPIPNLPLLRKILDHIDAHPEEWDQNNWSNTTATCGTSYCIAGHAVAMTEGTKSNPCECGPNCNLINEAPASGRSWDKSAAAALGLPYRVSAPISWWDGEGNGEWYGSPEASRLFATDNTRADVQRAAEAIAARAGEIL